MLSDNRDNFYRLTGLAWTRPGGMAFRRHMKRTDIEIWSEVLAGRSTAWNELIDKYQSLVYAVATRAGLSMADAADCFQQTFVLLYQHRQRISDPSRLSAWLVTTAKRESIRLGRQSSSVKEPEPGSEPADNSPLQDELLEQTERQALLEIALKQLDDRCQALLKALFFAPEELSYEQIAKSVGIAFNSLGPIRGRCLQRLRKLLEESGYVDVRNQGTSPL